MRSGLNFIRQLCFPLLCAVGFCALASHAGAQSNGQQRTPLGQTVAPAPTGTLAAVLPLRTFAPALAKVMTAVVTIRVIGETIVPIEFPARDKMGTEPQLLPAPRKEPFRAGGSGVIVDDVSGYVMTNNHVIDNTNWIQVGLSDGRNLMAELVGRDIGTDIAILKIKPVNLPSIVIGDSDDARVGDIVLAVGNPFGLEGTATMGIISAVMRTEVGHGAFEDYLQIDASINPGNSGGPLVNIDGELIGINTVGGQDPGRSSGIGFSIPINLALTVMTELIANGRIRRGSPGMMVEDLPPELAQQNDGSVIRGAIVTKVFPNSSALQAGINPGDIVVSAANKPVRSAAEFITRTVTVPLGHSIPFIVFANGQGRQLTLKSTDMVFEPEAHKMPLHAGSLAGAVVGDILLGNPLFGDVRGAQVSSLPPDSPAFAMGLQADDVIVGIDSSTVRSVEDLGRFVSRASTQYRVMIVRNGVAGWLRARH